MLGDFCRECGNSLITSESHESDAYKHGRVAGDRLTSKGPSMSIATFS